MTTKAATAANDNRLCKVETICPHPHSDAPTRSGAARGKFMVCSIFFFCSHAKHFVQKENKIVPSPVEPETWWG
jgi:hypothetical protein